METKAYVGTRFIVELFEDALKRMHPVPDYWSVLV